MSGGRVTGLRGRLDAWVAAGLIGADQAERIEAAEAAEAAEAPRRRTPYVVEALGYLGAALAAIAGFLAVDQLWPDIPLGAQIAFAGAGTVLFAGAASLMRPGVEPALHRLRSVLLVLSTGSLTAFAALLAGPVWDAGPRGSALAAAATAAVYATGWWLRVPAPLQHLTAYAATAVTVGVAVSLLHPDVAIGWSGLAVWVLSALWVVAAGRGLFRPSATGIAGAAVGLLGGAQLTMEVAAGHVLALATVAGLLVAGVARRQLWLLAVAAVGVLQVVPQTAARYLPASAAAPLALFVVGVLLVGIALWLARSSRAGHGPGTGVRPGHRAIRTGQ
jgi:hypothetical protein